MQEKKPKTFQYIWDNEISLKDCSKISEEKISALEMRRSVGLEVNLVSGERVYFVPTVISK